MTITLDHSALSASPAGFDLWSLDEQADFFRHHLFDLRNSFTWSDLIIVFIDLIKLDLCRLEHFTSLVVHHFMSDLARDMPGLTFDEDDEPDNGPLWDYLLSEHPSQTLNRALYDLGHELCIYIAAHSALFPSRFLYNSDLTSSESLFKIVFSLDFWCLYSTVVRSNRSSTGMDYDSRFFNGCLTIVRMLETPFGVNLSN